MVDLIAVAVALIALLAILDKHIPTGVLGSAALVLIGGAALVAVDDSSFANTQRLERVVIAMLVGFLLLAAHLVLMHWRSTTGRLTPRRRTTDWAPLEQETRPQDYIAG